MVKKGASESRVAMAELIAELDRTRKEYAKSTLQMTQLETQAQHLKDAELKKDQVISHLEQEIERKELQHQQEITVLQEEFQTKDTAWAHRVKGLELEVARLHEENQSLALFEKENRQLRETVLEHQSTIERLQIINEDLRSRAKNDTHEQAQVLEVEFKRRLAEAEKKFRAEAYRALSEEAKLALQGNDHLQSVLQRQNDSIEAVLLRCKQLEQAHTKIQAEQEISTQSLNHHMTEVQRLKKQLGDSRTKTTQLEDQLKQRKVERASLELLYVEYEATRKQLAKVTEKGRRAVREAERWRNRAIQLTHELGDEQQETGEAKLRALQRQSDRIEANLQRRRGRSAQRQRDRQRIAEGAAALRATAEGEEGEPTGEGGAAGGATSDDDYSQVSDEDVTGATVDRHVRSINPMEILAMWNINFESWRPPGSAAGADLLGTVSPPSSPPNLATGVSNSLPPSALPTATQDPSAEGASLAPQPPRAPKGGVGDRSVSQSSSAPPPEGPVPVNEGAPSSAAHGRNNASSDDDVAEVRRSMAGTGRCVVAELKAHAAATKGAASSGLAPVRPPLKVDDVRALMDRHLSVLAQPKPSSSAPALRHYGHSTPLDAGRKSTEDRVSSGGGGLVGHKLTLSTELTVVTHGDFKLAKRGMKPVESQQRFLVP